MKKYTLIALALIIALALCACGGDPDTTEPAGSTTGSTANIPTTPVGYTFTYNNVQFGVDMSAEDVIKALGVAKDVAKSESCAFGGNDIVYDYGSIKISTNDENGYERIYCIELVDDLASTEKGVCIGSTVDQVKAAYGEPAVSSETGMVYNKDGMSLTFLLTDGAVTSIQYYAG